MDERPQGAGQRDNALSPHRLHANRLWRSGRGAQLKLLRTLRGEGALLWSDGSVVATYELDVFARGSVRTVSGQVEGDFSRLVERAADNAGEPPGGSRLRLNDGREIEIDLISLEADVADFDAGASAGDMLLGGEA